MDDKRFDAITRRLTAGSSRREALRGVIGSMLGGIGFGALNVGTDAKSDCPSGRKNCGTKKKKDCVNPDNDRRNCGSCGNTCKSTEACKNGKCVGAVDPDCRRKCNGCCTGNSCRNGNTKTQCGKGGRTCRVCSGEAICDGGECVCPAPNKVCDGICQACCNDGDCTGAEAGTCVDGECQAAFAECASNDSSVVFVDGPADPPAGPGSAEFRIGSPGETEFAHLRTPDFADTRLGDIEVLEYATFVQTAANCGVSGQAPYLVLRVNFTGGSTVDDIIIYEPIYNGSDISCTDWQTWDAAEAGATYWSAFVGPSSFFTLDQYLVDHPDATLVNADTSECAGVLGGLRIAAGEGVPWTDSVTNVSFLRIKLGGQEPQEFVF